MPSGAQDLLEKSFTIFKIESEVKKRRRELGLSQDEMSNRLGVSQQFLSQVENGTRPLPERMRILLENTTK